MYRTGFSFRTAVGHLEEVVSRVSQIGAKIAPISDRRSTFGFNRWNKLTRKAGMRPVFGCELAVTAIFGEAKPIIDHCRFLAIDSIAPLNELIGVGTDEQTMLYKDAMEAPGVIKIFGERARLEHIKNQDDVFIGLSPAVSKGYFNKVNKAGLRWCAVDSNFYPREEDQEFYRVTLGMRSESRIYPGHILSEEEWRKALSFVASKEQMAEAIRNRDNILDICKAELKMAELFIPEKTMTLREMCTIGAKRTGTDLSNQVYADRLDHELKLIADKNFEDYFYIIADLVAYAKQNMIVGPARGSSCGSLVCYLLNITTIDPIPYGLIFERFIDINRSDLPDIDIDFSDERRHMVFEYAEQKYGKDHVARLGTVTQFQPTSAMNQAGAALRIPKFKITKTLEGVIDRSSGDARANNSLEDTLKETPAGIDLLKEFPEIMIASRMEAHPNNSGQHAAGIVITKEKVTDVVAIDHKTGATMCDKYDAEDFKLLKIDALGLTQLSIMERTLELIGEEPTSNGGFLDRIQLDDPLAFEIINQKRWPGIFQYSGSALQSLAKQFKTTKFDDIVSVTALARPGPLASGGANEWVKRRNGSKPVVYPHPLFEPMLNDSLGIVIYQETILRIGREIGNLSWEDVTQLRKAMSKSLGKEFFDAYGDRWKPGAIAKGIPPGVCDKMWSDLCSFGSWAFNKAHSVAYGMISYQTCWLKAHYPLEFAAATLDAQHDPVKQLAFLRELKAEGIDYVPIDKEHSTDRWAVVKKNNSAHLVGPLGNVKGIGPKGVAAILSSRKTGKPLTNAMMKKLANAKTGLDSLYPISDRVRELLQKQEQPTLSIDGVSVTPTPILDVQCNDKEWFVVVTAVATRIAPRDENDLANIAKRNGRRLSGPTIALNMFFRDDSDEILCRVDRMNYEELGAAVVERGKVGKALYAISGTVPRNFRMIRVDRMLYLGDI